MYKNFNGVRELGGLWAGIPNPSPCLHCNPGDLGDTQQNHPILTKPMESSNM